MPRNYGFGEDELREEGGEVAYRCVYLHDELTVEKFGVFCYDRNNGLAVLMTFIQVWYCLANV